jgi:hypothetical protein
MLQDPLPSECSSAGQNHLPYFMAAMTVFTRAWPYTIVRVDHTLRLLFFQCPFQSAAMFVKWRLTLNISDQHLGHISYVPPISFFLFLSFLIISNDNWSIGQILKVLLCNFLQSPITSFLLGFWLFILEHPQSV